MNLEQMKYFVEKVLLSSEYREKISPALKVLFDEDGMSRVFLATLSKSDEEVERSFMFLAKRACRNGVVYSQYIDAFSLFTKLLVKLISQEEHMADFVSRIYYIYDIVNRANSKGYLQELIKHDLSQLNVNVQTSQSLDYVIAHFYWMQKVIMDIIDGEVEPSVELDPKKCVLGTWLLGNGPQQFFTKSEIKEIHRMHNSVHSLGTSIYIALKGGQYHQVVLDYLMLTRSSLYLVSRLSITITEKDLLKRSQTDALTSLRNRDAMRHDLDLVHEKHKDSQDSYCVALLDIDFFKNINDTYGHTDGDFVLQGIAQILMKHSPNKDHVYRYGGEEFLIILEKCSLEEAFEILEKMRKKIQLHRFKLADAEISLTMSIGVAVFSDKENLSISQLTKKADKNLYKAKESGRNKTVI